MTLILRKEVKEYLDLATPAIVFFALTANQQIEILPTLKQEQKYDFSDGDLLTSNALEVLVNAYKSCLNNLLNWLMVMLDESRNQDIENLEGLIKDLLGTARIIVEYRFEEIGNVDSLNSPEWRKLHRFSKTLQQRLQIELEINTEVVGSFLDYWLHA